MNLQPTDFEAIISGEQKNFIQSKPQFQLVSKVTEKIKKSKFFKQSIEKAAIDKNKEQIKKQTEKEQKWKSKGNSPPRNAASRTPKNVDKVKSDLSKNVPPIDMKKIPSVDES